MAVADTNVVDTIKTIHNYMGHPGVNCTLYFVKRAKAAVTKRQVQSVVSGCHEYQSIDPAPVKWKKGNPVTEAVYLHNLTPKDDCMTSSAPANKLYKYTVRIRGLDTDKENVTEVNYPYRAGNEV